MDVTMDIGLGCLRHLTVSVIPVYSGITQFQLFLSIPLSGFSLRVETTTDALCLSIRGCIRSTVLLPNPPRGDS
jgi:hypothetical protein